MMNQDNNGKGTTGTTGKGTTFSFLAEGSGHGLLTGKCGIATKKTFEKEGNIDIEKRIKYYNDRTSFYGEGVVEHDALKIQYEITRELDKWMDKTPNSCFDIQSRQAYSDYLSKKYVWGKLDKLPLYPSVSIIRQEILKIIKDLSTHTKFLNITTFDSSNNITLEIEDKSNNNKLNNNKSNNDDESCDDNELCDAKCQESLIPVDNINLCFVGGVSTGKSTVLNGIFCEKLTECKIKRTTMVPTVYIENAYNACNMTEEIFKKISEKNQEIINKTESGQKLKKCEYQELVFNVGKLDINILEDSYVNVYDIPGLNDARTRDIYYDYLETNFHKFNLVVFIVDIHSGLNTSDEMDMLKLITNNTREQFETNKRHIYTLVIVNKADDMQLNEDTKELEITGELNEMYTQVKKTITDEFSDKNIKDNLIGIIPLCAIDSYLYRMVKKHGQNFELSPEQILKIGINENGKKFSTKNSATQKKEVNEILKDTNFIDTMINLSGFGRLEHILHNFLEKNNTGNKLRIDNLLYELSKLPKIYDFTIGYEWFNMSTFSNLVDQYFKIYNNIKKIDTIEYKAIVESFMSGLIEILKQKITNLIDSYNNFVSSIMVPYFSEYYDASIYPKFLTTRIISLINVELSNILTIECIVINLCILTKINMFDKETIESLFINIVSNFRKENAVSFSKNDNVEQLIQILDDCSNIGVNLSELMRFLIINRLSSLIITEHELFVKELLYKKYGELLISNFISNKRGSDLSIDWIIRGLKNEDLNSPNNKLDLYYLNYEKQQNSINFRN
jgi:GTP-binding protein EngB required for normal cell division